MAPNEWNKDLVNEQKVKAAQRYRERQEIRARNISALATRRPPEVDTEDRVLARKSILAGDGDSLGLERVLGKSDLFPISYLETGLKTGRSVCRVKIRDSIGRVLGYGTGSLVSPSLMLTNNHVLEDAESALYSLAEFNYENDMDLVPRPVRAFRLDPDRFFVTNQDLDFSLVAVEPKATDGTRLSDFGYLPLYAKTGKILVGEYVSIIQHPAAAPKAVAVRENRLIDVFGNFLHYATDTEPGSSGSPVFSDEWKVVGLHHSGVPDPSDSTKWVANEGIRISSIMEYLDAEKEKLSADGKALIAELFADTWKPPARDVPAGPTEVVVRAMEYYKDSGGYDPGFLGKDHPVPLPELSQAQVQDLAPTEGGNEELRYTHFSLVMSASRRLAFFTAVNIDGSRSVDLKRTSDKWYFDPRIDRKYQCGPDLYKSNELDRGHLVRRLDPVWGEQAKEANEDTFHFTNCSPQHTKLNTDSWLGLEDYILTNAGKFGLKVSVFTGPVFRDDDMLYRDEFRIPAEFWKVVAMVRDDGKLSATAYLQTQKDLIGNLEFAYGNYGTYQVPLSRIESLTGLSFGDLRTCDPLAGVEGLIGRPIERAEDIRL